MGTLEIFWTQFGILVLKRVSKFVILEFRDTLLVPKITKCGDLLYSHLQQSIDTSHLKCRILKNSDQNSREPRGFLRIMIRYIKISLHFVMKIAKMRKSDRNS